MEYTIDLRGVKCPYNFIKTKLKLEELNKGDTLMIFIDDGESINNVPRSIENEGYRTLSINQVDTYYQVLIEK